MMRFIKQSSQRTGTAAVEMALIAPLLVTLLLGVWEIARLVDAQQTVTNAAREGARLASVGSMLDPVTGVAKDITVTDVTNTVKQYLQNNGMDTTNLKVEFSNVTIPALAQPYQALPLNRMRVTVSLPFSNLRYTLANTFLDLNEIGAVADWYSMKDSNLVVTTTLPY